jgi:dihydrofolate synthase/folylpolyglutamate synthase
MTEKYVVQASHMEAWNLQQWLEHLGHIHPTEIELGLERVAQVYAELNRDTSGCKVITVAGTNGKGTTCAMLEQAILIAGKSVAVYSSPHLLDYRERVRVNGQMLSEKLHCKAFLQVELARKDISLTYFEFATLAALQLMFDAQVDYLVLEVGLGGRLDAVNIIDPDIAVITSIDLDHQDWLGDNREDIAREKAGIFRAGIPAVIGEVDPPKSLIEEAHRFQLETYWQNQDFTFSQDEQRFNWQNKTKQYQSLPLPKIPGQNASTALQVISLIGLDLTQEDVHQLLLRTQLPGRRQFVQTKPSVMLDVAHNPQATRLLLEEINKLEYATLYFVVAMLGDKDIEQSLSPLQQLNAHWLVAPLDVPRGAKADQLISVLDKGQKVLEFPNIETAYENALLNANLQDLIVVFGSFFTVAEVLSLIEKR